MTIDTDVKALWRAPFRVVGHDILDRAGSVVAFRTVDPPQLLPLHSYLWRDTFRAIVGTETDPDEVARLLTEAWCARPPTEDEAQRVEEAVRVLAAGVAETAGRVAEEV